jgi:hypothetical protein
MPKKKKAKDLSADEVLKKIFAPDVVKRIKKIAKKQGKK